MPKITDCDRCRFYAYSHLLVCAVHPRGATSGTCPDFSPGSEHPRQRLENFLELQQQTLELLDLLDTHPMLTGKCPACGVEMERDYRALVHWDCQCGWTDDSI